MAYVRGYFRRDGRYVQGHHRRSTRTGGSGGASSCRTADEDARIALFFFGLFLLIPIIFIAAINLKSGPSRPHLAWQGGIVGAHKIGEDAGSEDGRRVGNAEGFEAGRRAAHDEHYQRTLEHLYASGDFSRNSYCIFAIVGGGLLLGFGLQWMMFFSARKVGWLLDIDGILLTKDLESAALNSLSATFGSDKRPVTAAHGRTLVLSVSLLSLLGSLGCHAEADPLQDAWQRAYDASYKAAYQDGWQLGAARGSKDGEQQGKAAANSAAETGRAWPLYSTPATWSVGVGWLAGVMIQYAILIFHRRARFLPEWWTVAFVPGMKNSLAYAVYEKRRHLAVWLNAEMEKVDAARQIKVAQMRAIKSAVINRLKTVSSLQDFAEARLLDLAKDELSRLVSKAEKEASEIADSSAEVSHTTKTTCIFSCPHCNGKIRYRGKKAGKTVNCPHNGCGRAVATPLLRIAEASANPELSSNDGEQNL